MTHKRRVFVFGAGFSKPAGMPLASDLVPLLIDKLELDEMSEWLDGMRERLAWLSLSNGNTASFALSIEEVFHYAHFDVEVHRLRQHLERVGRQDGPGTAWNTAESIYAWLTYLEEALHEVILECDEASNLTPVARWARTLTNNDAVLTFNYDTLVERALMNEGKVWNHGTGLKEESGISVFKLHGSIDWIVAHRSESFKMDLLFDKENVNRLDGMTGSVEDDYRLWRCRTRDQLRNWIADRDLQSIPEGAAPCTVGIAGLGAYKELHQIPGLGYVWTRAMQALSESDLAVIVGFSMSDFDAMAQMQFAEVARAGQRKSRPMRVIVVDPTVSDATRARFRRVFHELDFVEEGHERFDWRSVQ